MSFLVLTRKEAVQKAQLIRTETSLKVKKIENGKLTPPQKTRTRQHCLNPKP